mgnify:CR=1 FL=1
MLALCDLHRAKPTARASGAQTAKQHPQFLLLSEAIQLSSQLSSRLSILLCSRCCHRQLAKQSPISGPGTWLRLRLAKRELQQARQEQLAQQQEQALEAEFRTRSSSRSRTRGNPTASLCSAS